MGIWLLTAVCVVGLLAFVRNSWLVRWFLPRRNAAAEPGRFEQFWSRRDGRVLAIAWLVLFVLTVGDAGMIWSGQWQPVLDTMLVVQQVAAVLLVAVTAGLYVYKRAIPQIARDEADERERSIQGDVYRRAHGIAIGGLAIGCALLLFNPAIGHGLVIRLDSPGVELIDVLLPAFLLLFMLPSVAYAWMDPHSDDESPSEARPSLITAWLARAGNR